MTSEYMQFYRLENCNSFILIKYKIENSLEEIM